MDLEKIIRCDCSHCSRKGLWLVFVPESQFTLLTPEAAITDYQFNKKHIHHLFCPVCGVQPFASGTGPDGTPVRSINVRTLDDIDLESLTTTLVHGKDF